MGLVPNEICEIVRKILIIFGAAGLGQEVHRLWPRLSLKMGKMAAFVRIMALVVGCLVVLVTVLAFLYEITRQTHSINGRSIFKTAGDEMASEKSKLKLRVLKPRQGVSWRDIEDVEDMLEKLLVANMDHYPEISSISWRLLITNNPIVSAAASPSGRIKVHMGMLTFCRTADELALILGHEIAHVLHRHTEERLNLINLNNMALAIVAAATGKMRCRSHRYTIQKMYLAIKCAIFSLLYLTSILVLELPFDRIREFEADSVGMGLAARACYNVTDATSFWARTWEADKMPFLLLDAMLELSGTHPRADRRETNLKKMLPAALGIQNKSSCFALHE